jgi:hypothetical protein
MSRVSEETIAPRIHIGLCGDESARCSASNRFDLPNRFLSVHAVVHNTFNAISSGDQRCGFFEPRPQVNGECSGGNMIAHLFRASLIAIS